MAGVPERRGDLMLVCTDVNYCADGTARAAAVFFSTWTDEQATLEHVVKVEDVQPYQPGRFFERELPCLLAALTGHLNTLEAVIIDGYVTLDATGRGCLGQHLFEALDRQIPVIGVAKTAFQGSAHATDVLRGGSQTPLCVTASGINVQDAADHLRQMHGPHRLPTVLKRVDCLCRDAP